MQYVYRAINTDAKTVSGELEAHTEREALRALRAQGLQPLSLQLVLSPVAAQIGRPRRVQAKETLLLLQQLTALLKAGVPLDEALSSLEESAMQPGIRSAVQRMLGRIRAGEPFPSAMEASGITWPSYVLALCEAGQLTGKLSDTLGDAADQLAFDLKFASDMRSALVYPAILIISGIAAVLLIFSLVVPKFANLLNQGADNLPGLAVVVLQAGIFFNTYPVPIFITLLVMTISLFGLLKNPGIRQQFWDLTARTPLVGRWLSDAETARWAAMLATLLRSKVELTQALALANSGMRNSMMAANLAQAAKEVRGGSSLSDALSASRSVSRSGLSLIRVGEHSGDLASMLGALANLYTEQSRERLKNFLTLLEPMAILTIGAIIGLIMTGIILAITSANDLAI